MNEALAHRLNTINAGINSIINANDDIKTIISIGSFSQGNIDEFSDIDLYIFSDDLNKYKKYDKIWENYLGKVISKKFFRDPKQGVQKAKIITLNGLMYDITFVNIKRFQAIKKYFWLKERGLHKLLPKFLRRVIDNNVLKFYETIKRGYKIHVDKINVTETVEKAKLYGINHVNEIVNEGLYKDYCETFWQCCYTAAVKLIRNDYLFTAITYDHDVKIGLLKMIEWNTLLKNKNQDVFYDGLKIEKWADKETIKVLPHTLLSGEISDMLVSLLESAKLFKVISNSVAKHCNYDVNIDIQEFVISFIEEVAIPTKTKKIEEIVTI